MRKIHIPGTSLTTSSLCLGCGSFGGSIDLDYSYAMLDAFLDRGGNFLDTAKVYADWLPGERSSSEKTLGRWMKLRGNRQRLILATKGAHPYLESMHISRLSPAEITGDLEASLVNLQTDCIDLYWLHRDDPTRPVEEIMDVLSRHLQAGKILAYGCSNWRIDRLIAAQEYARMRGIPGFAATQVLWNLAHVEPQNLGDPTLVIMDDDLRQFHQKTNLAAIPFSSQANGVFQKLENGRSEWISPLQRQMYLNPQTETRFQRLLALQAKTGLTTTQLVLGYLLSQPFPTVPVVGSRNLEQLEDTLSAADVLLQPEQVHFLDGAING